MSERPHAGVRHDAQPEKGVVVMYARHVGRVGSLAVALGVGAALIGTPAIGFAQPSDTDSADTSSVQPATNTSLEGTADTETTDGPSPDTPDSTATDDADADDPDIEKTDADGDEADDPDIEETDADGDEADVDEDTGADNDTATIYQYDRLASVTRDAPPADDVELDSSAATLSLDPDGPRSVTRNPTSPVQRLEALAAPLDDNDALTVVSAESAPSRNFANPVVGVVSDLLSAGLAPLLATGVPGAPSPTSALWVMLAWVRREFEQSVLTAGANTQQVGIGTAELDFHPFEWLTTWIEHTFFATTPTMAPPAVPVSLDPGQTSAPFELGGVSPDGKHLIYNIDGSKTGTGTEGGTLVISGDTATYTPPQNWDGATILNDKFTVTTSDIDSLPHLHGFPGLVHLLTFGIFGDGGHRATGTVTVSLAPTSATTVPVSFVNNTNGAYTDDEIYLLVYGQTSTTPDPIIWSWVDVDSVVHEMNASDPVNMTYSLAELNSTGALRIPPELMSARIYVSLGQPLDVTVNPDNTPAAPQGWVSAGNPNYYIPFDSYEFSWTYGSVNFNGNTTQVDEYGLPLQFQLVQSSSSYDQTRGTVTPQTDVFKTFKDTVPDEFLDLIVYDQSGNPLRILNPTHNQTDSLDTWLDGEIDDFWTTYTDNPFTYVDPSWTVTGQIDAAGVFNFTVTPPSGVGQQGSMVKPTTTETFDGNGPYVGNDLPGAFLAALDAAFNRGVATSPEDWNNVSAYYQDGQFNSYAQVMHMISDDGLAYGFPYDDVNTQSSNIAIPNSNPPSNLTITISF